MRQCVVLPSSSRSDNQSRSHSKTFKRSDSVYAVIRITAIKVPENGAKLLTAIAYVWDVDGNVCQECKNETPISHHNSRTQNSGGFVGIPTSKLPHRICGNLAGYIF